MAKFNANNFGQPHYFRNSSWEAVNDPKGPSLRKKTSENHCMLHIFTFPKIVRVRQIWDACMQIVKKPNEIRLFIFPC